MTVDILNTTSTATSPPPPCSTICTKRRFSVNLSVRRLRAGLIHKNRNNNKSKSCSSNSDVEKDQHDPESSSNTKLTATTTTTTNTAKTTTTNTSSSSPMPKSNKKGTTSTGRWTTRLFHRKKDKNSIDQEEGSGSNAGGVYIIPASATVPTAAAYLPRTTSTRTLDTRTTYSTVHDNENDNNDDNNNDVDPIQTTPSPWISSDEPDFGKDMPLLARRPSDVLTDPRLADLDDQAVLGHIMFKARHLPRSPGAYASNHVLINSERTRRMIPPLRRSPAMDELARQQARKMASAEMLLHTTNPFELQSTICQAMNSAGPTKSVVSHDSTNDEKSESSPTDDETDDNSSSTSDDISSSTNPTPPDDHRIGENVCRGTSIKEIHRRMMRSKSQKNNMLDRRFVYMGVGTAKDDDGILYLCQIFSS